MLLCHYIDILDYFCLVCAISLQQPSNRELKIITADELSQLSQFISSFLIMCEDIGQTEMQP